MIRSLLFALCAFTFLPSPAQAQDISAVVNGQVISDYDVGQRLKLLSLSGKNPGRDAAMKELVDEKLKMQEAAKLSVTVTDSQVDKAYAQISQRSKVTPENFTKALAARGVNADTLKSRLRAEFAWQQVIRQKGRAVMNIRDQDIVDEMKKKGQDPATIKSYDYYVMQAMVFVPKGGAVGDAHARAENFRASAKSCDEARQKATTVKDAAVREPVRRGAGELSPPLKMALEKIAVGGTTPVNQTENGFEFLVLCEKKAVEGADTAKAETKNELMVKEIGQASDRLLREVREKAVIDYRKK